MSILMKMAKGASSYPMRKQLAWAQCQAHLQKNVLLLVQLDNLDVKARLQFKQTLSNLSGGLALKFPKPGVLRAALRQSQYAALEPAVLGFTALLVTDKEPHKLGDALNYLSKYDRVTLIAGKIGAHTFSAEGIHQLVREVPRRFELMRQLVTLLQGPALHLTGSLNSALLALVGVLEQQQESLGSA